MLRLARVSVRRLGRESLQAQANSQRRSIRKPCWLGLPTLRLRQRHSQFDRERIATLTTIVAVVGVTIGVTMRTIRLGATIAMTTKAKIMMAAGRVAFRIPNAISSGVALWMTVPAYLRDWRKKTVSLPGWKNSCNAMAHCLPGCRSAFNLYQAPAILGYQDFRGNGHESC